MWCIDTGVDISLTKVRRSSSSFIIINHHSSSCVILRHGSSIHEPSFLTEDIGDDFCEMTPSVLLFFPPQQQKETAREAKMLPHLHSSNLLGMSRHTLVTFFTCHITVWWNWRCLKARKEHAIKHWLLCWNLEIG
jgi:hypothetical protein